MTARSVFLAFLLVCGSAKADVPERLLGQSVRDVQVEGDPDQATGVPTGAPLSRGLVRGVIRRLARSGRYADVQVDAEPIDGGARLIVRLTPRVWITRIDVLGNTQWASGEITRAAGIAEGSELSPDVLAGIPEAVRALYARRGWRHADAEIALRDTDDPRRKVVLLRVREGSPTRVSRLVLESRDAPRGISALEQLEIHAGDVVDDARLTERVRETELWLRARGYLAASVGPIGEHAITNDTVEIVVPIAFGPRYDVALLAIAPLQRGEILGALAATRERFADTTLRPMHDRVLDAYRKRGFLDARVTVAIEPTGSRKGHPRGRARIAVSAIPGPQVRVTSVTFPGATAYDDGFLRDQLTSFLEERVPGSTFIYPVDPLEADRIGFGGQSLPHDRFGDPPLVVEPRFVYDAEAYDEGITHIRELYQAAGHLDAQVGPARLDRRSPTELRVVIPISEGPRTELHELILEGNALLSTRDLVLASGLLRGAPFSYVALQQGVARMLDLYRERGHAFAHLDPTPRFSADRRRADIVVRITESFPVRIGSVSIRGAASTSESMILDRVALRPGDLYVPSRARLSQERLLELGIFASATIGLEDPDVPERIKTLIVNVAERPAQYFDLSGGISTGQGARGGFEYGYRNLFGSAVGLSMRVQLGYQFLFIDPTLQGRFDRLTLVDRLERRVNLGITAPYIPSVPNVRLSADLVHLRDNERDFGYDKNAIATTVAWRPYPPFTLTASGELENNRVGLFVTSALEEYLRTISDPRIQRLLRVPQGESTLVSARLVATLDLRDSPFVPTRGFFASAAAEYAVTLSTDPMGAAPTSFFSNFVKVSLTANGYVPIWRDVVFAMQARFGRIFHLSPDSRTYPNRLFFMGGVDTLRGYLQDQMVPQDIVDTGAPANSVLRGGDTFLLLRGELRFPIYGPLGGAAFADVGNLWADASRFDALALVPIAGLGVRLGTPVGPIAFDYGFVLLDRKNAAGQRLDPIGNFHFSIGVF